MHDRPNAQELLATLADWLDREAIPALDGGAAYRARVAANLAHILEREARLGPAALERERELVSGLVGGDGSLEALNARLSAQLLEGAGGVEFERRALAALFEIARAKLAIARPGYESYDASAER